MRRLKRGISIGGLPILFGLLLVLTLLVPHAASAQAKSADWERYDVTVDIQQSGQLAITEDQTIAFEGGPFSQGYAVIPLDRVEDINNVQVSGASGPFQRASSEGQPGTYTVQAYGGDIEIRWWFTPATNESRQFTIQYDAVGALRVYPDTGREQLWWRAIDTDFAGDIAQTSVTVNLPEPVSFDQLLYEAQVQGIEDVQSERVDDDTIVFRASNIEQGSALEVRVEYPHITQATPPAWQAEQEAREERAAKLEPLKAVANLFFLGSGLLIILGAPVGIYLIWQHKGKDTVVELPVDMLREPPDDLPPGAVGTLIDERADTHDLIAIMIGLAERGVITITELDEESIGAFAIGGRDWIIRRVDHDAELNKPERELLSALLGSSNEVRMSDARERFGKRQGDVKAAVYDELVDRGYFPSNPESVRKIWRVIAFVIIGLAIFGGVVLLGTVGSFAPFFIVLLIGIGVAGIAALIAGRSMPRKTDKGALAAARWAAFRRYLAEIDRQQDLSTAQDIFNKYLPYAIAFGIEKSWVRKFAEVGTPAPDWYGPYGGGRRRRRYGMPVPVPVFIPGAGYGGDAGGGDASGGGGGGVDVPDLQDMSDSFAGSLQGMSDGLFDMFDEASKTFQPYSSSGSGTGLGRGGGFSGGFSGGFGGGFGGGGGGGGRGFS